LPIVDITDANDPRIAAYTQIKERDLTGRGDRFIVEGKVTLGVLVERSVFEIESLFLSETRLEPLSHIIAAIDPDIPVYVARQTVMDDVAGFSIHRGVLACARKGQPRMVADIVAAASTTLLLAGLSNHDNVGACFRNAAALGADAVLLDGESCDPLYRKAIRVSAGTALWLPFVHAGPAEDHIAAAKAAGFDIWALTPRVSAADIRTLERPEKLALLLGAEGPGLPASLIEAATPVRIPMAATVDSLNVATAAAVALSHAMA